MLWIGFNVMTRCHIPEKWYVDDQFSEEYRGEIQAWFDDLHWGVGDVPRWKAVLKKMPRLMRVGTSHPKCTKIVKRVSKKWKRPGRLNEKHRNQEKPNE